MSQLQAQAAIIRRLWRRGNGGKCRFRGIFLQAPAQNPAPMNVWAGSRSNGAVHLRSFPFVRRQNGGRGLTRIIHSRNGIFLQLAQSLFFLLLLLRQVFLTLFILIIRFCQFITLIAGRLDCNSSEYMAKMPSRRLAFCADSGSASSESAAYRQKYVISQAESVRGPLRPRFIARAARLATRWHPLRPADNARRAGR